MCLSGAVCFQLFNEIKLFMEKEARSIEELKEERWTNNPSFLVNVAGHLHNLAQELRGKDKLIIEMYDNINVFKLKFCCGKTN